MTKIFIEVSKQEYIDWLGSGIEYYFIPQPIADRTNIHHKTRSGEMIGYRYLEPFDSYHIREDFYKQFKGE